MKVAKISPQGSGIINENIQEKTPVDHFEEIKV
jgi:hypothetical protein